MKETANEGVRILLIRWWKRSGEVRIEDVKEMEESVKDM